MYKNVLVAYNISVPRGKAQRIEHKKEGDSIGGLIGTLGSLQDELGRCHPQRDGCSARDNGVQQRKALNMI